MRERRRRARDDRRARRERARRPGARRRSSSSRTRRRRRRMNLSNLAAQARERRRRLDDRRRDHGDRASLRASRVFATGGIGGVHRDGAETGDVSADLTALARHPVAVVCAGAKAILDLPRTVRGARDARRAGVRLPHRRVPRVLPALQRPRRRSQLRRRRTRSRARSACTGISGSAPASLVANPIPRPTSCRSSPTRPRSPKRSPKRDRRASRGRDVTPFLLDRLRERTGGASVRANVALLAHNARVAAALAGALARLADTPAFRVVE